MIVNPSDTTTQALLQVQPRPMPPVVSPPNALATTPVTPPVATSPSPVVTADPLTLLLQSGAADPPETPLPSADLARRYAESGTLTQRAATDVGAKAPQGNLAPADTAILSNLSQAYRQTATATPLPQPANVTRELANAQIPNAPATAGNTPAVIIVDGRSLPLNPAQIANVRASIESSFRKIGPAIGGSDAENPTLMATEVSADDVITNAHKVASVEASPRSHIGSPERRPLQNELPGFPAALADNETVEAVQAVRQDHPALYEPQLILPRPQDQTVIAPGPDRVLLAGQQPAETAGQSAITGIAVALAPGITRDDVTAELHQDGYRLSFAGSDDAILLHARAGLSAQLVFADGTSMRLQLNHD